MTFDEMFAKLKEETLSSVNQQRDLSFHDEDTFGNKSTFTTEELDCLYLISSRYCGRKPSGQRNDELARQVMYKMLVNKIYMDWVRSGGDPGSLRPGLGDVIDFTE